MSRQMQIAILGGGICGQALAYALSTKGMSVRVFEQAASSQEIGAGIGLGANACLALERLGLLDSVVSKSDEGRLTLRSFEFVTGDTHELIYDYPTSETDFGLGMHRAALLDAITSILPPGVLTFNKRCISIVRDQDNIILGFADGTNYAADVLLGCDGIKSATREFLLSGSAKPVNTNYVAYRGLVPSQRLLDHGLLTADLSRPRMYCGQDKHLITFPVKGGSMTNIVAFAKRANVVPLERAVSSARNNWVETVELSTVQRDYEGWGTKVQAILQSIENPTKWTLHALDPPLSSFVSGRIALVGDAAHAMLPHLGAGAGQGLEDALLLTQLLTRPDVFVENVEFVLRAYDAIRVPRANAVLEGSARAGDIYEGRGPSGPTVNGIRQDLEGIWDPVWHGYDLEEAYQRAANMFLESIRSSPHDRT
ncbi:FAD/NAD-P-binding domain-containing protein [Sistotremastrum niveocremeum HHB9708]|uniref:FAD/NAD-P-binding domain-containing protein n=1 Tax=Sistotremastrum niveocremeum HHB9708 TaxID=1314777 RepID=A0A164U9E7_9AGAM|nr:FAD/NAD-P-binding domain-containing protein [Sistotremastrum niveocremeum HHB9708]